LGEHVQPSVDVDHTLLTTYYLLLTTYYLLLTTYYLPSVDVDHTRARRRLLLLPRELVQHLVGVRVRVRDGVRC